MSAGHLSNLEVSYLLMEHGARIFENNLQGLRPLDFEPVSTGEGRSGLHVHFLLKTEAPRV